MLEAVAASPWGVGAAALLWLYRYPPSVLTLCMYWPPSPLLPLQAAATPRTPQSPNTPLTPKLTGTSTHGPQFFDNTTPANGQNYGLELFLASEASAVVEHTKQ